MRSDLMNLPPQTLTQLVWAALQREGWTSFIAMGDGAVLSAMDGKHAVRVAVVYTARTNAKAVANFIETWLSSTKIEMVTHRELICLTRRPAKPARFFPTTSGNAPLIIRRRADLERMFTEGALGERLLAWRTDDPFMWSRLPSSERLKSFLESELCADQFTKLSASSADSTRRTPLSKVFTDREIELSGGQVQRGMPGDNSTPEDQPRFIQTVHDPMAPPKMLRPKPDRRFVLTAHEAMARPGALRGPTQDDHNRYDRVVLMGGPGQGKTTLGVYLCQSLRAGLLDGYTRIKEETLTILHDLHTSGTPKPIGRRLPLRVELYRFAERLAQSSNSYDLWEWLEDYSAHRPSDGEKISRQTWREWLTAWPSCIVFDGLDEVPPSANRKELLEAISAFLNDLYDSGADIFVVLTTRPQGYRNELRHQGWQHYELKNLRAGDAIDYAKLLYGQWHSSDSLRLAELLNRFERTINERSTSALAQSPLQVTILCVLIEQLGHAPKDRWRLFREYYRIIFERERERGIESVGILRDQQELVDRLHAEVGYRLQLADERQGGAAGAMNPEQVRRMVTELLEDEGHSGVALNNLADKIILAAFDRLVFLVGHSQDRVGFEVRALQEFFAAERLLRGEERLLEDRLIAVAASAHWQNVVLFAAGRILAERDVLLPILIRLCEHLDRFDDGMGREAGMGAKLALRLLSETGASNRPKVMAPLRDMIVARLSGDFFVELEEVVAVLHQLKSPDTTEKLKAMTATPTRYGLPVAVLVALACAGDAGAIDAVVDVAGNGPPVAPWYFPTLGLRTVTLDMPERLLWALMNICPSELISGHFGERINIPLLKELRYMVKDERERTQDTPMNSSPHLMTVHFKVIGTPYTTTHIAANPSPPSDWLLVHRTLSEMHNVRISQVLMAYLDSPGSRGLAKALRISLGLDVHTRGWLASQAPWPLEQCLHSSAENIETIIQRAEAGHLGDLSDWIAAETRWINKGFTAEELAKHTDPTTPIYADLATSGAPKGIRIAEFPIHAFELLPTNLDQSSLQAFVERICRFKSYYHYFDSHAGIHGIPTSPPRMTELTELSHLWDQLIDAKAAIVFESVVHRATQNPAQWSIWEPRLLKICAIILEQNSMGFDYFGSVSLASVARLITAHPEQPSLIALIDLSSYYYHQSNETIPSINYSGNDTRLLARICLLRTITVTVAEAPALAKTLADQADYIGNIFVRVSFLLHAYPPPGSLQRRS